MGILYHAINCFVVILSAVAFLLYTRMGIGERIKNSSSVLGDFDSIPALLTSATDLEIVAKLPFPPGNIAVSRDIKTGTVRTFFSFHPEYKPPVQVAELVPETAIETSRSDEYSAYKPFPGPDVTFGVDDDLNGGGSMMNMLVSCLALRVDDSRQQVPDSSVLYLLDFADHGLRGTPALYGFKLRSGAGTRDQLWLRFLFPSSIAGVGSMLNDLVLSADGSYLVIADTSIVGYTPAIIVFDVAKRRAVRALSGYQGFYGRSALMSIPTTVGVATEEEKRASVRPVRSVHVPNAGPLGLKIHLDSIALSSAAHCGSGVQGRGQGEGRLYYGALTGDQLYSLSVEALLAHTIRNSSDSSSGGGNVVAGATSDAAIAATIQQLSLSQPPRESSQGQRIRKPVTDGLLFDCASEGAGGGTHYVWFTASEDAALGVWRVDHGNGHAAVGSGGGDTVAAPTVTSLKVVQDPQLLRWPDGLSWVGGGTVGGDAAAADLYVTNSALQYKFQHHGQIGTAEKMRAAVDLYGPYHILRVRGAAIKDKVYGA